MLNIVFVRIQVVNQNTILRFRTNNQITTGAPKILVMALIGNIFTEFGSCATVSHSNIKMAP